MVGSPVAFWGIPQGTDSKYQLWKHQQTQPWQEWDGGYTSHLLVASYCSLPTLSFLLASPFMRRCHKSPPQCFVKSFVRSFSMTWDHKVRYKNLMYSLRNRKGWPPKHKRDSSSPTLTSDAWTGEKPLWWPRMKTVLLSLIFSEIELGEPSQEQVLSRELGGPY